MAIISITPAHDPSVMLEFEIPIKGRQNPLFFTVPKMQYFPLPKSREFNEWVKPRTVDDNGELLPVPSHRSGREIILKMLELNVSTKDYAILEKLTDGELLEIDRNWEEHSKVTLGESSASSDT
ncbi:hypothetical protein ABH922_002987 [Rhodococcus sp. 27YEA15]|uniref:hypothetical protein n=1 Tax=Rhodococcus sp. 27YEA15 TaxID=3156259 RepID=UPI003C7B91C2